VTQADPRRSRPSAILAAFPDCGFLRRGVRPGRPTRAAGSSIHRRTKNFVRHTMWASSSPSKRTDSDDGASSTIRERRALLGAQGRGAWADGDRSTCRLRRMASLPMHSALTSARRLLGGLRALVDGPRASGFGDYYATAWWRGKGEIYASGSQAWTCAMKISSRRQRPAHRLAGSPTSTAGACSPPTAAARRALRPQIGDERGELI